MLLWRQRWWTLLLQLCNMGNWFNACRRWELRWICNRWWWRRWRRWRRWQLRKLWHLREICVHIRRLVIAFGPEHASIQHGQKSFRAVWRVWELRDFRAHCCVPRNGYDHDRVLWTGFRGVCQESKAGEQPAHENWTQNRIQYGAFEIHGSLRVPWDIRRKSRHKMSHAYGPVESKSLSCCSSDYVAGGRAYNLGDG